MALWNCLFEHKIPRCHATYDNTYPLMGVDVENILKKTSRFSLSEMESKKNSLFLREYVIAGRGGYVAILLFKRHIKKIFSMILTTCYRKVTLSKIEGKSNFLSISLVVLSYHYIQVPNIYPSPIIQTGGNSLVSYL